MTSSFARILYLFFLFTYTDPSEAPISLDEFFEAYQAKAGATVAFYTNATIESVYVDPLAESEIKTRYRVSSNHGMWISELLGTNDDDIKRVFVKREDGSFSLSVQDDRSWKPISVTPLTDARGNIHTGLRADDCLLFFCRKCRPFSDLPRSESDGYFTKASRVDDRFRLHFIEKMLDETHVGWYEFDAASMRCLGQFGKTTNSLDPSLSSQWAWRFEYSGTDAGGADLISRVTLASVINGVESVSQDCRTKVVHVAANPEKFRLDHYGLSENLLASKVPRTSWWDKIPTWSVFLGTAVIFFGLAGWMRRGAKS